MTFIIQYFVVNHFRQLYKNETHIKLNKDVFDLYSYDIYHKSI